MSTKKINFTSKWRSIKTWKKTSFFILLFLLGIFFIFKSLFIYAYNQAQGQLSILYNARPIESVLNDSLVSENDKVKIKLIQNIKKYAFDSLGINYSENYSSYFDQKGKPILWMLTACKPFSFEQKEWSFPVIGSFSYKGYFDTTLAHNEVKQLLKEGYEIDWGEVSGWSTLGWFKDPILSDMLTKREGNLANLIIHELTHGTLYIKNNVEYNENLANFVGDKGALMYLENKYGKYSKKTVEYENGKIDSDLYSKHVLNGATFLDSIYKSNEFKRKNIAQKNIIKKQSIQKIMFSMDTISFLNKRTILKDSNDLPNNTFFMHYIRYTKHQNNFEIEFTTKFNSNFPAYLTFLKIKYKKDGLW